MTKLRHFLRTSRITQADFARRLGISPAYISELVAGLKVPGLDLAVAIEDASGGLVRPRDMVRGGSWPDGKALPAPLSGYGETQTGAAP